MRDKQLIQRCNSSNETVRLGNTWIDKSLSVSQTQIVIQTHFGKSDLPRDEGLTYVFITLVFVPQHLLLKSACKRALCAFPELGHRFITIIVTATSPVFVYPNHVLIAKSTAPLQLSFSMVNRQSVA